MSVRILIGDVREQLAKLEPDSIDCVVTSPPYWGLRDYGVAGQLGLESTLGEHIAVMVEVFRAVRRVMKPAGTLWLNYGDCYACKPNGRSAAETKALGTDTRAFRDKPFDTTGAIDPGGAMLKPKDLCLIPERLAIALQADGWWVRAKNVWGKPNPMPDSRGRSRPSMAHEMVWMLSKSSSCFYDADAVAMPCSESTHPRVAQDVAAQAGSIRANGGTRADRPMRAVTRKAEKVADERPAESSIDEKRRLGRGGRMDGALADTPSTTRFLRNYEDDAPAFSVWHIPTVGFTDAHFATFPPELVEVCILAGCPPGGHVLDPFAGAGTVGLVADALGRTTTLIELSPDYAALAARRLKAGCVRVDGGDSRRGLKPLPLLDATT